MTTELKNRVVWGVGAAVLVIITMFWLGPEASFLVATAAGLQGWREYCRLMGLSEERPSFLYLGYILLGAMFTHAFFLGPKMIWLWIVWVVAFVTIYVDYRVELRRASVSTFEVSRAWTHLCRFILGIFYIFMLFGFIGPIIWKPRGDQTLLLVLVAVFLGDTAAYFVGKARGRRKVWPELSPGKTIEGTIGGWFGAVISSAVLFGLFKLIFRNNAIGLDQCLVVGFCAGPLSQAGDFMESLMKRVAGRKDSGTLLPGHGGILDRADGLVFVMPLVYFLFS